MSALTSVSNVVRISKLAGFVLVTIAALTMERLPVQAQDKSVRPGVNDSFLDPNVNEFVERFEIESREVFAKRKEIVERLKIEKGSTVADVGAGTGLFTRLFSDAVGPRGQVIAVDIAQNFLNHIAQTARETDRKNIQTLLSVPESTNLVNDSIDVAFICDTYHHFEFPLKTMRSLHAALKPDGRVFVIDFKRIEGESSEWTLSHVRAGQEVFEKEILACGFRKVAEHTDILKENYFLEFAKVDAQP
ncbi:MAG: class I SAM-dependent methyltransferase [Planctomycetaceae bacterium]